MSAFLIVEVKEVFDEEAYAQYRARVPATMAAAGGAYLVRGGELMVLEGDWNPNRIVVVRFDSSDAARRWWESSDYSELKEIRHRSANANIILVEGERDA